MPTYQVTEIVWEDENCPLANELTIQLPPGGDIHDVRDAIEEVWGQEMFTFKAQILEPGDAPIIREANALLRELVKDPPIAQSEFGVWECAFCHDGGQDGGHAANCLIARIQAFLNKQEEQP